MLSGLLRSSRIGTDIIVIAKARVPIVKFVTVQGGFKVDISLNMLNGIQVGKRVQQLFKEVGEEPARALIMVTKAFLSQRSMNEVFSGGLGSYSIICLVVSFLQVSERDSSFLPDLTSRKGNALTIGVFPLATPKSSAERDGCL